MLIEIHQECILIDIGNNLLRKGGSSRQRHEIHQNPHIQKPLNRSCKKSKETVDTADYRRIAHRGDNIPHKPDNQLCHDKGNQDRDAADRVIHQLLCDSALYALRRLLLSILRLRALSLTVLTLLLLDLRLRLPVGIGLSRLRQKIREGSSKRLRQF